MMTELKEAVTERENQKSNEKAPAESAITKSS